MSKLIIGCGYLGRRVADRWLAAGHEVAAVCRTAERASVLRNAGIEAHIADVLRPETLRGLPKAETVLYAIGWDRSTGVSIRDLYVSGLRNVLAHLPEGISRFVYVSSTGVFGQTDGSWVDEESVCQPTRIGGLACLAAETLLREHPLGDRAIILRLAGIYGPDRIPRRRQLLAGQPIAAPSEGFLNLIHVQDAARIVLAAEQRFPLPGLLCVSDGHPVVRGDYYRELARLVGAAEPRFVTPAEDAPATARASSNKRVSNKLLLEQLDIDLDYPSYRQGLAAECASPEDDGSTPAGEA